MITKDEITSIRILPNDKKTFPTEEDFLFFIKKGKKKGNALFISISSLFIRARDGTRTRGPDLGKVVLHQLSHSCVFNFEPLYPTDKY